MDEDLESSFPQFISFSLAYIASRHSMAGSSDNQSSWDVQSKDAKRLLAEDQYDDCTACRVTGSAAFIGLGVYSYYTGMSNLRKQEKAGLLNATKYKMGSRQLGIAAISATLVGMGIYRALN
ncbi:hypothetical protein EYZ11_004150 [Aspergillus tanneri]|uniref:Distal membrane-arm assembly complex protein 1-like domain-containing protein n=1 Tax=Aspergillus tanneri TaxID=1220188 RepID=A0A4S3JLA0_9EURO|nr:uncharacterized protein ATNIH1004_002516 [Aspergillus tanneri]KAA8649839.1 hypothetical protein ATNIH1004_002516 [Aspergillus tanneri]THC96379.1 hypothetical protein EYZ11_004150 [Aspergillus tanneri]